MAFKTLREAPEAEVARLAAAPEGSRSHALAALPVNITGWIQDLVIELPWAAMGIYHEAHRVVVVPIDYTADASVKGELPRRRHAGWWNCVVISSDDERYPVGGHRLAIPEAELVRGTKLSI